MNNKGQLSTYAYVLMLATVIIILALSLAKPINEKVNESRTEMNCTGTTDEFVEAGCIVNDWSQAYWVGSIIAIAGIVILGRLLFPS